MNFRVISTEHGPAVEVDLTITVADWALTTDWKRLLHDLTAVNGVRSIQVDDQPLGAVRQMTDG